MQHMEIIVLVMLGPWTSLHTGHAHAVSVRHASHGEVQQRLHDGGIPNNSQRHQGRLVPEPRMFGVWSQGFLQSYKFEYINMLQSPCIEVMTLNFMCHLGLPGQYFYAILINSFWVGALPAPTQGKLSKRVSRHVAGSPGWTRQFRVICIWRDQFGIIFVY